MRGYLLGRLTGIRYNDWVGQSLARANAEVHEEGRQAVVDSKHPHSTCPGCGKGYFLNFPPGEYGTAEATCEECGTVWQVQK